MNTSRKELKSRYKSATELSQLEELWLEKLQPYGERGYHDRSK